MNISGSGHVLVGRFDSISLLDIVLVRVSSSYPNFGLCSWLVMVQNTLLKHKCISQISESEEM